MEIGIPASARDVYSDVLHKLVVLFEKIGPQLESLSIDSYLADDKVTRSVLRSVRNCTSLKYLKIIDLNDNRFGSKFWLDTGRIIGKNIEKLHLVLSPEEYEWLLFFNKIIKCCLALKDVRFGRRTPVRLEEHFINFLCKLGTQFLNVSFN